MWTSKESEPYNRFPCHLKRRWNKWLAVPLMTAIMLVGPCALRADDEENVEKQLRKVCALAADPAARPIVSQATADFLKVSRMDLVQERSLTNLSYGTLFLVHQFNGSGISVMETAAQLHTGKSLAEIGNEHHANWHQIDMDAKKLNDRIEAAFYNFFLNGPNARRKPDDYAAAKDSVPADTEGLTKQDMAAARETYARCYRRARGVDMPRDLPDQKDRTAPGSEGDPR
jgi:hypothetical protein